MTSRLLGIVLAITVAALLAAAAAQAHQTAVNNGVAVTMHVVPDDEPRAGDTALLLVPRVSARRGKFSWATCRCTMSVRDSSARVLFKGRGIPRREYVFPEAGAYRIDFTGRVRRNGKWATFKVWFAVRAY